MSVRKSESVQERFIVCGGGLAHLEGCVHMEKGMCVCLEVESQYQMSSSMAPYL